MMRVLFAAVLLAAGLITPALADYDDAIKAYERGDYAAAIRELRPLAEQGNVDAQAKLGSMYMQGEGVDQDFTTALRWLRLAAAEGDASAESNLGRLYYNGLGVKRDFEEAFRWFLKSANQGYGAAQMALGSLYAHALGVKQDNVRAYMWYQLASIAGEKDAARARDTLGKVMRPGDVAQAQRLATNWKPRAE